MLPSPVLPLTTIGYPLKLKIPHKNHTRRSSYAFTDNSFVRPLRTPRLQFLFLQTSYPSPKQNGSIWPPASHLDYKTWKPQPQLPFLGTSTRSLPPYYPLTKFGLHFPHCLTSPLPRSSRVLRHSWYLTTHTTPSQRPTLHPKPRSIIPNSSSPRSAPQPYPHPHSFQRPRCTPPCTGDYSSAYSTHQTNTHKLASSGTDKHGKVEDQKTPDLTLPDSSGSGRVMLWNRTTLALPCRCASSNRNNLCCLLYSRSHGWERRVSRMDTSVVLQPGLFVSLLIEGTRK
jgi:hypothetical protein